MSEVSKSTKGVPATTDRADDVEAVKNSPPQDPEMPKRRKNVKRLNFSIVRILFCSSWVALAVLQLACSVILFQLPEFKKDLIEVPVPERNVPEGNVPERKDPDGNGATTIYISKTGNKTVFSRRGGVVGTAKSNSETVIITLTDCFFQEELHGPAAKLFGQLSLWFYGVHIFATVAVVVGMVWVLRSLGTVNFLCRCNWALFANAASFAAFEFSRMASLYSKLDTIAYQSRGTDLTFYFYSGTCCEFTMNGCVSFIEFFMMCNCTFGALLLLRQLRTRIRHSGTTAKLRSSAAKDNKHVKRASK